MNSATDPRVLSAEGLLSARHLLAGPLPEGPIRPQNLARALGVSIWKRHALVDWIEEHGLWIEPPCSGPLADHPLAGTVELARVAELLRRLHAKDQLPPWAASVVAVAAGLSPAPPMPVVIEGVGSG